MVNSLQGGLHGFYGTWQRCNSLEWERPEALPEGPREAGIGQWRGCRSRACGYKGTRIPLRGRIFLRKTLLRPMRSHHSASLRLALHPKNRTLHPVQLLDLG
jgi:hypothetical protein